MSLLQNRLYEYCANPRNDIANFNVAVEYDKIGQTASALSFYLRAAELTENKTLAYNALLRNHINFQDQGRRVTLTKSQVLHAITLLPKRPEAYYLLSKFHENHKQWEESYSIASIGLELSDFSLAPLTVSVGFPGYYALAFQKAVAGWWVGRCDEARALFRYLADNYEMEERFAVPVRNNLKNLRGILYPITRYQKEQSNQLRYKFKNYERIDVNCSQTYQDMFVLSMLDGKENGTYVEIGAGPPFINNNTAILETKFNWKGISIDIDEKHTADFATRRKNPIYTRNALEVNYKEFLDNSGLGKDIDYLQVDCEPAENSYKILELIPFDEYRFAVITFEHDYYCDDTKTVKERSRKFFYEKGYLLVAGDVSADKISSYEDWWVHPDLVSADIIDIMTSSKVGIKKAEDYMLNKHGDVLPVKKKFDWGNIAKNKWFHNIVDTEINKRDDYQKYFKVEEGDVVVDVGASVGPFAYKILKNNPSKIYCLEPEPDLFKTLTSNLEGTQNVITINKGITSTTGKDHLNLFEINTTKPGVKREAQTLSFTDFIAQNNIQKIDFLKLDCEGNEYDIFTEANVEWIKNNVRKIAGEWHLDTPENKQKFIYFRDNILKHFSNYEVTSWDMVDIKWFLFEEKFTEYYTGINIYIDNRKKDYWRTTRFPTMEFTTSIPAAGCVVDCAFCPQRTLVQAYSGTKSMSMEDFKIAVDKLPQEVRVTFAGFTEPWLNRNCSDMVLYAHQKGHPVSVFTTGIGMSIEDIKKIKNIPFTTGPNGGFCLHLPDEERIAKHPISKKYLEVLEYIKSVQHEIKGFYVMSMGPVHSDVKHIFSSAHTPEMWSRAGNLLGEAIIKPELAKIKDRFKHMDHGDKKMTCNCTERLYHNVCLPNGDVSLCCMDYGLKYIIGNLLTQEYDNIVPKPLSCFTLCQRCENGIEPHKLK
jgi:FkbM family methyltransferase